MMLHPIEESKRAAQRFVGEMGDKLHVAELKPYRARRSLDANAYLWVLLDKLAEALSMPKTGLYRSYIKEIGGNNETVCIPDKGVEKLRQGWGHNGLGWVSDTALSKLPGCTCVVLYYGSSTYDRAQMARLIDLVVQDCKDQGIETLPPERLAQMKEAWDA